MSYVPADRFQFFSDLKTIFPPEIMLYQEFPFTDRGIIVEIFSDMSVWMGIKGVIDRINANAAA